MITENEIQKAKDEMFPYQENVGRSYEQALAASGFELGAHFVLNRLKSDGMLPKSSGDCNKDETTPFVDLYIITSMNQKQYVGDFDCKGFIPNKGDVIKVDDNIVFEVSKREINYKDTPRHIALYVRDIAPMKEISYEKRLTNKQVKEMDLENLFQALPEKIVDEKLHQVYELSIYHYDGQCVVDYIGEIDHDSLYTFSGNTLYEAIEKAWNWLHKNSTGG